LDELADALMDAPEGYAVSQGYCCAYLDTLIRSAIVKGYTEHRAGVGATSAARGL
jgi:hypothetical protein